MAERTLRLLRTGTVQVLVLALLAGIFLPVYSDEIGWRFQERAGIDGVDRLFNDSCGPNTLARPPFFMMPVRWFSAYTNLWFADPLWVRISGIAYAFAWLWLLFALARRISAATHRNALVLVAIALAALANTPLLLVMSRPEQPIVLAATAALLLAFSEWIGADRGNPVRTTSVRDAWCRSLAIVALGVIALSYHLKGLFILPLLLACLWFCCRGRASLLPRAFAGLVLVIVAFVSVDYWLGRLACPDDPVLAALLAQNSIGTRLVAADGIAGLLAVVGDLIANVSLSDYITLAAPVEEPMSHWLPPQQVDAAGTRKWELALLAAWGAAGLLSIYGLASAARAGWRERHLDPRAVLSVVLIVTVIGWSATQGERNVYEVAFVLPLLSLAAMLSLAAGETARGFVALRSGLAALLGIAAIASMAVTAMLWLPSMRYANRQEAYIPVMPYSVPTFGYGRQEPEILGLAKQCGIPEPERAHRVLIDELTYFAFMPSRLPEHRLGAFEVWNGSIDDPLAYLKSRKSDGIIVGCRNLPANLRGRAISRGAFCCLAPPHWGSK